VELIELLMSKEYPGQNRGFAFVEFHNHACAQAAKNTLSAPTYMCAR
jgi:heterogeneous nuclear ribonucleoprotein R